MTNESIAEDRAYLGELNATVSAMNDPDAINDLLTEELLQYEFGDIVALDDFEVIAEELDEESGFMFTTYQSVGEVITLFSKYDETDKHSEMGIYRADGSTTKLDYSSLNDHRGVVMQHASDFYTNDSGEKQRDFALIYDDKSFIGEEYLDNETGLWKSESTRNNDPAVEVYSTKYENGIIHIDQYDTESNSVNVQLTNDIGTVKLDTDHSVQFGTYHNLRDGGGLQYMQYDENGNETGYERGADGDVDQDIYNGFNNPGDQGEVNDLLTQFQKQVTEISHWKALYYEHESTPRGVVMQINMGDATAKMIDYTNRLAELGAM
ncbi:MAG: hypothetical protein HRT47_02455 [Candidatus Caenarcaniphilales bacterium]|nr:hypothetical protein [Candidatus Caenarcaniphilales bacterium]